MNDSSALNTGPVQGTSTAGERPRRGRPPKAVSDHRKEVIRSMAEGGASASEIAEYLGVCRQGVHAHIQRMTQPENRARKSSKLSRLNDRLSLMRCRRFIALMCLGGLIDEDGASEATGLPPKMFRSMMTYVQEHMPDRSPAAK